MNKRKFLKYLLSTFPILHLNQLYAENAELIQRQIPKDQKKIPAIGLGTYVGFNIDEKSNKYKELAKPMHRAPFILFRQTKLLKIIK